MRDIKYVILFFILLFAVNSQIFSQNTGRIRIMFYNVENLFDTVNDPATSDDDFTPKGKLRWTYKKYTTKLLNIYKVIAGVGETNPPEIIGLCEVENWVVLNDLLTLTPLSKYQYTIVHRDSPDPRGIDVAILYRSDILKLLDSRGINITFPDKNKNFRTRDILMAKFLTSNADTLYTFTNHWPSRRRGELETSDLRMITSQTLKKEVNCVISGNINAKIVIMGDMNDEPTDMSLLDGLHAQIVVDQISYVQLYNLSPFYSPKLSTGTHKFRGKWEVFDQVIVSGGLLKSEKGLHTGKNHAYIFCTPFILQNDESFLGEKPFPTYSGYKYLGGYSDHLPVYIDLFIGK